MPSIINISDKQSWNSIVSSKKFIILEVFNATMRSPDEVYRKVATSMATMGDNVAYVMVDTDMLDVETIIPNLAGPPEIPTFFLLEDGEVKDTLTGERAEPETAIETLSNM